MRGFFGIGVENLKTEANLGTLWRSALAFGASFIFTTGQRYKHQYTDTPKTTRKIPLLYFRDVDDLIDHLPHGAVLVGVETGENLTPLERFSHPERAVYLLGAEDHGLTERALERAHALVTIPSGICLNVAVAGSIVMYDRQAKGARKTLPRRRSELSSHMGTAVVSVGS